jgi:hypothetical protein
MENEKLKVNYKKNLLMMTLPPSLLAVPFLISFGESVMLIAVPLAIGILLAATLAKRLDNKDAAAYPFVQYSFLLLFYYFAWAYPNTGLALIVVVPLIYIINTAIGYIYFRFVKNKRMPGKVFVLLLTLIATSLLYNESYGQNRHTPILFRMLGGDFGYTSWTREVVRTDTKQISDDGIFEYQMKRARRFSPLRSNTELWLLMRNINSDGEHSIRLDNVMNEDLPPPSSRRGGYWSTMQAADSVGQIYLLSATSTFAVARRWVFEIDMKTQSADLLEQIRVGMLGRTKDDRYIAHLYMANFFDGENRAVRLVMRDTETGNTSQIPIDIDVSEAVAQNFNHGWDLLSPAEWLEDKETGQRYMSQAPKRAVEIMLTDMPEIYIALLREGFITRDRRFELDMNIGIMKELR